MQIRPYQRDALRLLGNTSRRRSILSLPTGTGKTFVAAYHAKTAFLDRGRGVVWIAHSEELLDQAYETFVGTLGYPQDRIGRRYAGHDDLGDQQGRMLWFLNNLVFEGPSLDPALIVIDEAHHAPSKSYTGWLSEFRAFAEDGPRVLGLTATPYRLHEGQTRDLLRFDFSRPKVPIFEEVTFHKSFCELAAEGFVAPFRHVRFDTGQSYEMKLSSTQDFTGESLEQLNNPRRNQFIVNTWRSQRDRYGKTLIFVGTQDHAKRLGKLFGEDGSYVISDESDRSAIEAFRRGDIRVLVNVGIFKEGVDVPDIQTVILARPTTSAGLFTQMVGRGSRILPGKPFFYLIDIHDQLGKYEDYLAGAADLADRNAGLLEVATRRSAAVEHVHRSRFRSLGEAAAIAVDLFALSPEEVVRLFEGWIEFWSAEGKQTNVALLLDHGDYRALRPLCSSSGDLSPAQASAIGGTTPALQRVKRALEQGLLGKVRSLSVKDMPEIADLREHAAIALNLPPDSLTRVKPFIGLLQERGASWGVPEAAIGTVVDEFVRSRSAFAGALRLVADGQSYLKLVGREVTEIVRQAVASAQRGMLAFADAPRIQAEIEKAEPDLAVHGQRILQAVAESKSLDSFCILCSSQ